MSVLPRNTDPSKDYVTQGYNPPLTQNGLVYNQIYAHTGVVDTLNNTNQNAYADPNLSIINNSNNTLSLTQQQQTQWISSADYGDDVNGSSVTLKYYVANTTYFNTINFNILNVPCYVQLLDYNGTILDPNATFSIAGGNDIYTTTDWVNIKYVSDKTLTIQSNTNNNFIQVVISRNKLVQQPSSSSNTLQSIPYSVGIKNLSLKLNIQSSNDVPISGIATPFIVQNKFGFIEQYNQVVFSGTNAFTTSGNNYWKSAPQPVGDAVVNFYIQTGVSGSGTMNASVINKLYLDPIYSGCKFNMYYTTYTGFANAYDPSNYTWTPIQRDFIMHKGLYNLPNITSTYIKLEFTQLAPEPYDMQYDYINRNINVFPYYVEQYYADLENNIIDGASDNYYYLTSNNNQAPNYQTSASTLFGVASNSSNLNSSWPSIGTSTTSSPSVSSASYIIDPSMSYKLIDSNGQYNGQSYTQFLQRRFPNVGTHNYSQITVKHNWHQAYYAGLYNVSAFYEKNTYDDLKPIISNLISSNNNNQFSAGGDGYNYILLNPDDTATTQWFSTIDTFKSFNIGALTTDWQSFLTDSQVLMNDTTNLITQNVTVTGSTGSPTSLPTISNLGSSTVSSVIPGSGTSYIQTGKYAASNNVINYLDANYLNGTTTWSGLGGTTLSGTLVNWVDSGNSGNSGMASGINVSGGIMSAAYNFTIPGVYSASGTKNWTVQLGSAPYGVVGFASYNAVQQSVSYYFLTNAQVSGNSSGISTVNGSVTLYTQFVNPITGVAIPNTVVSGSTTVFNNSGSSSNITTLSGTNYTASGIPTNTIQLVISGTTSFNLYQLGAFNSPTSTWTSPSDRSNMRISAVSRVLFPTTSNGTYRFSLLGTDANGTTTELANKQYNGGTLPINTWINVEVPGFSNGNYVNFSAKIAQTNSNISGENYYVSMLSPFYHPIRYEFTNVSGTSITAASGWHPIVTGINDPNGLISTVPASGLSASGIQVRMTSLDPNVFVCGLSIIPHYKQNAYYANLDINYIGNSKTNESSERTPIQRKPMFMLNHELYPARFSISQVVSGMPVSYITI